MMNGFDSVTTIFKSLDQASKGSMQYRCLYLTWWGGVYVTLALIPQDCLETPKGFEAGVSRQPTAKRLAANGFEAESVLKRRAEASPLHEKGQCQTCLLQSVRPFI
jgi:hypothetical protein